MEVPETDDQHIIPSLMGTKYHAQDVVGHCKIDLAPGSLSARRFGYCLVDGVRWKAACVLARSCVLPRD
jgi:hypothetical protein